MSSGLWSFSLLCIDIHIVQHTSQITFIPPMLTFIRNTLASGLTAWFIMEVLTRMRSVFQLEDSGSWGTTLYKPCCITRITKWTLHGIICEACFCHFQLMSLQTVRWAIKLMSVEKKGNLIMMTCFLLPYDLTNNNGNFGKKQSDIKLLQLCERSFKFRILKLFSPLK
jgi:hypothetical protein